MIEESVLNDLNEKLLSGNRGEQTVAATHIRDLCAEKDEYRHAFGSVGTVQPLVGLLESSASPDTINLTYIAAQALGYLAESDANREAIRAGGGLESLISVLKALVASDNKDLRRAVLSVLLAMSVDEGTRGAVASLGLVPVLVQLLGAKDDPVCVELSARLIGRLAYNRTIKDAVRDAHGITGLLKLLQPARGARVDAKLVETVAVSLTVLAVNNELNQDAIREGYGVAPIVKMLEVSKNVAVTGAAADAIRAIALNNDANKNAVREAWALPLLVKMLGPDVDQQLVGKAIDCLRILTTGNDGNKVALFTIPSSLSSIVRLLGGDQPMVMMERAAAVLGNLSTDAHFFAGLREAGAVQRLVDLLEAGPRSRVTEIAAKTLANLAVHDSNQTAIRLGGGIPPLMRLLTLKPSDQVLAAAEEALRRLQVSGAERNAILDTLRYVDSLMERSRAVEAEEAVAVAASRGPEEAAEITGAANTAEPSESKPFTRYTVEETADLLKDIGFRDYETMRKHGVTGGDLLELTDQELMEELRLPHLQAKKVRNVQAAFKLFNSMMRRPGQGDITFLELQDWLQQRGRSEADVASIRDGYRGALGKHTLAVISFRDFARTFSWFASTLQMMAEHDDDPNKPPGGVALLQQLSSSVSLSNAHSSRISDAVKEERANGNGAVLDKEVDEGNIAAKEGETVGGPAAEPSAAVKAD